jgi:hypothetical protein
MGLVDKKTVNYRMGDPEFSCAGCEHYAPPDSCAKVKGEIAPNAICDLQTPKPVAESTQGQSSPEETLMTQLFGG